MALPVVSYRLRLLSLTLAWVTDTEDLSDVGDDQARSLFRVLRYGER